MYYTVPNTPTMPNNNLLGTNFSANNFVPLHPMQNFQQNNALPFLNAPPPNLPAAHHVFQHVPAFTNNGNQNNQVLPASSIVINTSVPPPVLVSSVRQSLPDVKPFDKGTHRWNQFQTFNNRSFTDTTRVQTSQNFQNSSFTATKFQNMSKFPFASSEQLRRTNFQNNSGQSVSTTSSWDNKQWSSNPFSGAQHSSNAHRISNQSRLPTNQRNSNYAPAFSNTTTSHFNSKFAPQNSSNYESKDNKYNFNSWNAPVSSYKRQSSNFKSFNNSKTKFSYKEEQSFSDSGESSNNFQSNWNHREYGTKPWMTEEISAEIEKKRLLFSRAKSSNDSEAWELFRKQRNHISGLIRTAKNKLGIQSSPDRWSSNKSALSYACDTCDRAFASESELSSHSADHIRCDVGNCQFEAHPKIVSLHKKMQHDTGYADAISKLKDNEDIEKWREERRRRFPTASNILKRKAEQAEKEERGEVIENKEFGKFKKQKFNRDEDQQSNRLPPARRRNRHERFRSNKRNENQHQGYKSLPAPESDSDSEDDSHIKIQRFLGIRALHDSENLDKVEKSNSDEILVGTSDAQKKFIETQITPKVSGCNEEIDLVSEDNVAVSDSDNLEKGKNLNSEEILEEIDLVSEDNVPVSDSDNLEKGGNLNSDEILIDSSIEVQETIEAEIIPKVSECIEEIPVASEGNVSVICIENEIDHGKEHIISETITIDSDDEAPLEIPILKALPSDTSKICGKHTKSALSENCVKDAKPHESDIVDLNCENPSAQRIVTEASIDSVRPDSPREKDIDYTNHKGGRKDKRFSKKNNDPANMEHIPKSTLLEKLLADDIRHERNLIMQCIRHVVKKDFFGIGKKDKMS